MKNYPQQKFWLKQVVFSLKALNFVLDTVFPKTCLSCGKFTVAGDFDYICKKCFGGVNPKNTFECIGCKKQTHLGLTCLFCAKENKIDQLLITTELSDPVVEKMLKTYKYKFVLSMVRPLSVVTRKYIKKLLSKNFNLFEDNPIIIPVPLHKNRLNWRGFNQAGLLAKVISDTYHISYRGDALRRIIDTKHQADIKSREERLGNIKNNFAANNHESLKGKTVILVDDICTTGATLNECANVLKENGAKRVIGFVIARGQFKKISNF